MLRSTTAIRSRSQCSANCEITWSIFAWFALVPRTRASPNTRVSPSTGWRAQNSTSCGVGSSSPWRSSWYRNWSATSRVFLRLPILSGAVRPPWAARGPRRAHVAPTRPFTRSGRGHARGAPTRPIVPQLMDPITLSHSLASGPSRMARSGCNAPATRRCVMRSLKRAATIANVSDTGLRATRRSFGARPAISVWQRRQEVPELVALCAEVFPVGLRRRDLDGYALGDVKTVSLETDDLLRIVGQELQVLDPEIHEDLGADAVVAKVSMEAQRRVGFDRVLALVLKLVGAHLVEKPDPAPLLPHINEDPAPLRLDPGESLVELKPAVASA